ncbi:allophanate hydrolase subunit 1 [Flavobacterium sp. CG_9.10]|uniref:DinB family protein n=1 Tax=Flavobacterium sp. CG_9.10 TaxID=2787729 RepID=UPI0018C9A602|nr:DinB family protein [Flavobacterium sp. CG_9.10]MBG6109986.1 allophanate hydrolase subunit 1 [Flavobacterium sp. CG_9.10]
MLIPSINNSLNGLVDLLNQLSNSEYYNPCASLSNSSIGEHTRHIIEMFQCLEANYEAGIVNYDNRKRNIAIQTDTEFAISQIRIIQDSLEKQNKKIELQQIIDGEEIRIDSNYFRELLYNLEHCIHHQALIKVAVLQNATIIVDENFGVARSTIEYRKQCVQ